MGEIEMKGLEKNYPLLELRLDKLSHNIRETVKRCQARGIQVAGVVKVFNGIPEALRLYEGSGCAHMASSRLEHFEEALAAGCRGPFMAIRIPMLSELPDLVRLADYSLQSDMQVIEATEAECARQGKTHKVILMMDLGDLREGFWEKEELIRAAVKIETAFRYVKLAGVGTNLGCYGSIKATPEKMRELTAVAEAVEAQIGRKLEIVSGGGTSSFPMVLDGTMPPGINHLRIGEAITVAYDLPVLYGIDTGFLHQDAFVLKAEIVELRTKASYPVGEISYDAFGCKPEYTDRGFRRRAVMAVGKVDFALWDHLLPVLPGITPLGASSDHLLLDVEDCREDLKVGDVLEFRLRYGPLAYLSASRYVRVSCI